MRQKILSPSTPPDCDCLNSDGSESNNILSDQGVIMEEVADLGLMMEDKVPAKEKETKSCC